jgi:hypothetical protein
LVHSVLEQVTMVLKVVGKNGKSQFFHLLFSICYLEIWVNLLLHWLLHTKYQQKIES